MDFVKERAGAGRFGEETEKFLKTQGVKTFPRKCGNRAGIVAAKNLKSWKTATKI